VWIQSFFDENGSTRLKLGKVSIKIFDKEITVVDAFRFFPNETTIKALKLLLSGK
jgi:hypothetical protein